MEVLSLSGKLNSSVFKYEDAGNGLENYQINEEIGEGTFGKVYSAIDKKTGESLAIKKITHLEYVTTELVREISILKHMQMECILQIKDVVPVYNKESDKNNMGLEELYIIMERADTDLRRLTQSSNYLTDEQIRKILYQILCGVKYIHSADIVHRDLKPGNILVNGD